MKNDIRHFWDLLIGMTEKELRARYKHTVFGFFWLVANPLLQMLVIGFVFTFLVKDPVPHYYLYLFIGLLAWNFFSSSLTKATPSIVNERALIKKAAFPRAVIPLSIIFSNLIHFVVATTLFAIPVLYFHTYSPNFFLSIVAAFVLLVVFTAGLSLATCALNVRFRDVNFFVQAILIVWFYVTPIIYPLSFVPYRYYWVWRFNPLTSVVQLFQHGLVNADAPGLLMLSMNSLLTILTLIGGIVIFRRESKNFDDWL